MALIEVRGLTKLYPMGTAVVRALDGVDLSIERGEFVAITGASGSGKSTMMHLLGCLDRPTAGKYLFDGRDVGGLSDRELAAVRNRKIGFVFQTFNLINRTSAVENVGVPLFYARKGDIRNPAQRALERVGLTQRSSHQPSELSGGERQRVAIARAIVNDPLLVLADEPTGNLDSRTGEQIMQIFRALNTQGVTIIMVTHELDIAEQARRVVHMRDGNIVSDRLTADILAEQGRVARAVAPPPQTAEAGAEETAEPAAVGRTLPPQKLKGAMAGLVCGLIAMTASLVGVVASVLVQHWYGDYKPDPTTKTLPPMPLIVGGATSCVGTLVALVMAILAIVFSVNARRRAAAQIGNWVGRRRATVGLVLGIAAIVVPLASVVINMVAKRI